MRFGRGGPLRHPAFNMAWRETHSQSEAVTLETGGKEVRSGTS